MWTRYYYDGLNIVMTRESSAATGGAGSWLTRRAYTLKQASIGQIVAVHTATALADYALCLFEAGQDVVEVAKCSKALGGCKDYVVTEK